jgi:hypothetical protein
MEEELSRYRSYMSAKRANPSSNLFHLSEEKSILTIVSNHDLISPISIRSISIVATERLKDELLFRNFTVGEVELSGISTNAKIKFIS